MQMKKIYGIYLEELYKVLSGNPDMRERIDERLNLINRNTCGTKAYDFFFLTFEGEKNRYITTYREKNGSCFCFMIPIAGDAKS